MLFCVIAGCGIGLLFAFAVLWLGCGGSSVIGTSTLCPQGLRRQLALGEARAHQRPTRDQAVFQEQAPHRLRAAQPAVQHAVRAAKALVGREVALIADDGRAGQRRAGMRRHASP